MATLWGNNWLYVARTEALAEPGTFRVLSIGNQNYLVLRSHQGNLRGFHNTCRHRGSLLCDKKEGRLGHSGRIVCPYHQWAYDSEDGALLRTSSFTEPEGFNRSSYRLFRVAVAEWQGCVFLHPDPSAAWNIDTLFQRPTDNFGNFPLESMRIGHRWRTEMACNWKTFWENFNDCLHCPNIHPKLSEIVPLYKQYFMEVGDDPEWEEHQEQRNPLYKAGLAEGKETWSADGAARAEYFPDLTPEEIERGHNYCETIPSAFIVGHVDYVRVVRILPLGPEKTEVHAQWLFRKETLADPGFDAAELARFAEGVIEEDGAASELNQKGLHSVRHESGTLMAEEYAVHDFQNWVRAQLG